MVNDTIILHLYIIYYWGKMMSLKYYIQQVMKDYPLASKGTFKGTLIRNTVTKEFPEVISVACFLDSNKYYIKGSIGNGQFAEVPWVAVFDRGITTTATKGIYIVLLFAQDMSGVYLSLNQGFTYFSDRFKKNKGTTAIKEINKAAKHFRNKCKVLEVDLGLEKIDLKSSAKLAQGYCAGHIAGKYYKDGEIPDDDIIKKDIEDLLLLYDHLINLKGWRSIDEFYDQIVNETQGFVLEESSYIEELDKFFEEEIKWQVNESIGPENRLPVSKQNDGKEYYPRDPKRAANALDKAGYKCENEIKHITFTRRTTGKNYTEPHHLIPISAYNDFEFSLDIEANICSLCCSCHNCLHYGVDEERLPILKKLYEERKELLKITNIYVDFKTLKKYYNIK